MPDVSVIVPSFQQGRFLARTLASIRGQRDVTVELIVLDACSDDDTGRVLDEWHGRIDTLVVEPDDGQADAIRTGISMATSPCVTWLNADDCYAGPHALSKLTGWLQRRHEIDLVFGRRIWVDASGAFLRLDRWQAFDETAFRSACYLPQECAVFRREAYERAGGIDPSFSFALDYDLWIRMLDAGSHFFSVPDVVGLFRMHEDQKSTARWHDTGLPEVARIQQRSLGQVVDESAMVAIATDHLAGIQPGEADSIAALKRDVGSIFNGYLAGVFRDVALDGWPEPAT